MLKQQDKPLPAPRYPQQELLLDHVRREIARGQWRPGQRLPTVHQMAGQFGISSATAQSAVHQLARDGFVEARSRKGLFVAARPPNRSRFALVFPHRASAMRPWSLYWQALAQAAVEMQAATGIEFPVFYDVESVHDTRDFEELVRAVTTDCVAGIIFAHSPHLMKGTPVLDHPGMPRVAFMGSGSIPGVRHVTNVQGQWMRSALEHLKNKHCRRSGILLLSSGAVIKGIESQEVVQFRKIAREMGLETCNLWIQAVSPFQSDWAAHVCELMFNLPRDQRPDGLIIHDDNLAESAQRGMAAAGMRVPEELRIVVNCNYPCPPPSVLPMHRMGLDTRELLATCAEIMLRERSGHSGSHDPMPLKLRTDADPVSVEQLVAQIQTLQTVSTQAS